jgi:hypothetical protein
MKIGFIFECGPKGVDVPICKYLVNKLDPTINFTSITLGNKKNLIEDCGKITKLLLESDRCEKVIILWDLYPNHKEEKPCRRQDREEILARLQAEDVDLSRISLVCISGEIETWLIADHRAIKDTIANLIHPYKVGKIAKFGNPDEDKNPKKLLRKIFKNAKLGTYNELQHPLQIVKNIKDFSKIKNSESFRRFALKVTGITL